MIRVRKSILLSSLPPRPGVYSLKNARGEIIYIGKSTNIRKRVETHLSRYAGSGVARKNATPLASETARVDYIVTANEPEALIKESELIKKYQPRYNIMLRDDKQYFYVCFTNETFPRIVVTHQPRGLKIGNWKLKIPPRGVAGPFTDGKSLKTVLRYLRRAFPYYTQTHRKLPCQYCHIGLCPGPDPNTKGYKKDIAKIKAILNGRKPRVITSLKKEMAQFAKGLEFEKAAKSRDQIRALENIFAHNTRGGRFYPLAFLGPPSERASGSRPSLLPTAVGRPCPLRPRNPRENKTFLLDQVSSLEAYDISNIQGKEPVASMVRFDDGKPNKSMYRKFKIRFPQKPNDTAMIREVIHRRLAHPEWPYPDAFLIDGGRGQLNAALQEFSIFPPSGDLPQGDNFSPYGGSPAGRQFSIVALAKKHNELYVPNRKKPIPLNALPKNIQNLFMHARDEAHRFAISYHRKLHRKTSLGV